MLRLLFRQRRRLIIGSFFGTLGVMMVVIDSFVAEAADVYPAWFWASTLALTSLLIMICAALVGAVFLLVFPGWRQMVEMIGLVTFFLCCVMLFVPTVYHMPVLGALMPFVITMALFSLIYGEALDRFKLWVDHNTSRSFHSPKTAEALWRELVPGAAPIADHWDGLLYELEGHPDDEDTLDVKYTMGGSLYELQTMTFLEKTAPFHAKYHHVGEVDPKNRSLVEGTYEIQITPQDGGGCRVTLTETNTLLLPRIAFILWFDDHLGDKADHLRARHLGRKDWSQVGRARRKILKYA